MSSENRYKLIISNRSLYKEIELSNTIEKISVGTRTSDEVRLHKDAFFESFSLTLYRQNQQWELHCSEGVYLSERDSRKLMVAELSHGKDYYVKYRSTDNEFLKVSFQVDFGYETIPFDFCVELTGQNKLSIGTAKYNSDITVTSDYSDDEWIVLTRDKQNLRVTSVQTKYGIYLNGSKIGIDNTVKPTDFISVAEVTFYYTGDKFYVNAGDKISSSSWQITDLREGACVLHYPLFNRNTRLKIEPNAEPIDILDPPAVPQKPKGNIILKLLPALAMVALTVVVRGFMSGSSNNSFVIFSVCSMSIGVITSIASFIGDGRSYKKNVASREEQYLQYIEEKKRQIESCRKEEAAVLHEIYYDTSKEIEIIDGFQGQLFDRVQKDKDFLAVRIGTGEQTAVRAIAYKKQEKFATDDKLAGIPESLAEIYKYVHDAPVTVELAKISALGIVAQNQAAYELIKGMLLDIASRQYTNEVELVLMIPEEEEEKYKWARWFPHFYNTDLQIRNIVWNEESRNIIFEYLYTKFGSRKKNGEIRKHIVVIAVKDWGIKLHPLSRYIENSREMGVSFVFVETHQDLLPLGCDQILFAKSDELGELVDSENRQRAYNIKFSSVEDAVIRRAARRLAPVYCEEVSLENSLTKNITLFELLNIYSAEEINFQERWASTDIVKSMCVPLGVKTKDEVIYLDLHEAAHGPHGLVAGTTGSGKSEILQTYILSIATLFHPYEVGFVIIDFKGGGMVNQFKKLPHLLGSITNIDGREIDRSLLSIKAELQKRQRLFAEYGVNNINAYIRLYKNGGTQIPLPHLVLIVDEFAELKADQPEFMKELISASRIGRSLGVHLILATQKPSGQVSEQIWSNSKFKLCLKVQTREDSNEVIKSPLAAEIKEPGRAYLQVGNNELFELFQSAYSGAKANVTNDSGSFVISKVELGGKRSVIFKQRKSDDGDAQMTQLEAIVEATAQFCQRQQIRRLPNMCLPPLEECIEYPGHTGETVEEAVQIPLGIYDDPANQYQGVASLNISSDNTLILGSTQMGKTNLLQVVLRTIGERFSPGQVQIYILDFASMTLKTFERMNHVGGVVIPSEGEKLKNLFKLLKISIQERKDRLLEIGVSSYNAAVEAGYRDFPRILVMLDNFSVFKELYEEAYENDFQYLTREGPTYGLSFIVTNARTAGFGYRYMANFGLRLALTCNETTEYSNLFERCRMEPKNIPGRILLKMAGELYEAQTYLAFQGEKEVDRANAIKEFVGEINERYPGERARCIPSVPEILTMKYLRDNYRLDRRGYVYPAALDYASVEILWLDFGRSVELSIVGKDPGVRNTVINNLLGVIHKTVLEKPLELHIIDSYERPLKRWSEFSYVEDYTIDCYKLDSLLQDCAEELEKRQEIIKETGIEAAENMPLLLYVIHSDEAIEHMSDSKELSELYNKITKMARMLNVMFIFSNIEDVSVGYNSPSLLKKLKESKRSIVTGKLDALKFYDIPISTVRAMKGHMAGDAYYITGNDVQRIKMVEE